MSSASDAAGFERQFKPRHGRLLQGPSRPDAQPGPAARTPPCRRSAVSKAWRKLTPSNFSTNWMQLPATPQPMQWNSPFSGLTMNEAVSSWWNGHLPAKSFAAVLVQFDPPRAHQRDQVRLPLDPLDLVLRYPGHGFVSCLELGPAPWYKEPRHQPSARVVCGRQPPSAKIRADRPFF